MKYFIAFSLLITFSCRIRHEICAEQHFCIKLNSSRLDGWGLPIQSPNEEIDILLNTKSMTSIIIEDNKVIFYPIEKKEIRFYCSNRDCEIFGSLLIPKFKEIKYAYGYSPETLMPNEIRTFQCYSPIRTGMWKFVEHGNTDSIIYNIKLINPESSTKY